MTGGAGFIGTALARRLVAENEIVVLDNLHRDSLTGTDLAEHENLRFVQGDVLDLPLLRELSARATHVVHLAAIAGVDSVLKSPVRTMRVNLIGTSNVLEAARGRIARAADRLLDQRGLRHARLQGRGDARHLTGLGRRGALDVRRLQARGRVPRALGLRRVQAAVHDDPAVQRLRAGPAWQRCDPPFHGRALAGEEMVIHGDGSRSEPGASSTTWSRRCSRCSSARRPSARCSTSATRARW